MSETKAGTVAVIDQAGRHHSFDADDWTMGNGHVEVTKEGKRVAAFAPGFLGVYRTAARVTAAAEQYGGGGGGAQ